MTHLDTSNTSYGQKKGRKSNWQFGCLKVGNHLDFLVCKWRVTYRWKNFNEGYNFALDFIWFRSLHAKLWAPKVAGDLVVGISGLPIGSPRTKWHLGVDLVAMHKIYYKGEGGGFPQVQAVMSLVSLSLPVACLSTKSVSTMHSPTCCLILCKLVWVIDCCHFS